MSSMTLRAYLFACGLPLVGAVVHALAHPLLWLTGNPCP